MRRTNHFDLCSWRCSVVFCAERIEKRRTLCAGFVTRVREEGQRYGASVGNAEQVGSGEREAASRVGDIPVREEKRRETGEGGVREEHSAEAEARRAGRGEEETADSPGPGRPADSRPTDGRPDQQPAQR